MTPPFQNLRLEADSLYALINDWAQMQLTVAHDYAVITGFGFHADLAGAFSALVPDWEASIFLPTTYLDWETGTYSLELVDEKCYASRNQQGFLLPDVPVVVVVVSMPE